jgi:hypothetical protein
LIVPASASAAVHRVDYRAADGDPAKDDLTFFSKGGLQLVGDCSPGSGGADDDLDVIARTTVANSALHYNAQYQATGEAAAEDDDFDPGEDEDILGTVGTDEDGEGAEGLGIDDDASGQIVYAKPAGGIVTVDWLAEEADAYGGARDCVFAGTAQVAKAGSKSAVDFSIDANGPGSGEFFFQRAGLRLQGNCDSNGETFVLGSTTVDHAAIAMTAQPGSSFAPYGFQSDDDFRTTDSFNPLFDDLDHQSGQLLYSRPDGVVLTIDWMTEGAADEPDTALGVDCVFAGTVRLRKAKDPARLAFRTPADTAERSVLAAGGLLLRADCDAGGDLDALMRSATPHSTTHYNRQTDGDGTERQAGFNNLGPDPDSDVEFLNQFEPPDDPSAGQVVYSAKGGTAVSLDWLAFEGDVYGDPNRDCVFAGNAEVAKP